MQFHFFNFLELLKSVFLILRLKSKMARIYLQKKFPILGDHIIEKTTRNFSLVTCYLLKFTRCRTTRYSLQNLLVTCCRSCSLHKTTRYLLQKLLVSKTSLVTRCKIRSLLVAKVARCKKSLVTRCKSCLLLVAEVTRFKKSPVTRFKSCSLLVAKVAPCRSCSLQKFTRYSLHYYFRSLLTKSLLTCKINTNKSQFQLNLVMDENI